jgi:hypothetical protein
MSDVADYRVISEGGATLRIGGDTDTAFDFPLGTAVKHAQHAVLQCFYESSSDANNLNFTFTLNGTDVRTIFNVTGRQFGPIHVAQNNVTKNNNNKLEIRIGGVAGAVRFRDIVLFVQREV